MPFFTAIGTAIFGAGTFMAGITTFALKMAAGIGMSLIAQALAGKPKDPTFAINGKIRGGGDLARSFIIGRTATAGSLVWVNSWGEHNGTDNAYLTYVIALSDLPVKGLDELWVNGENVGLDLSGTVVSVGDNNVVGTMMTLLSRLYREIEWGRYLDVLDQLGLPELPVTIDDFVEVVENSGHLSEIMLRFAGLFALSEKQTEMVQIIADLISARGLGFEINAKQLDVGVPVPAYHKDGVDHLWVKFYNGTQTEADSYLIDKVSNATRTWDENRIGDGVAYAVITVANVKNMYSGFPEFKFVLNGVRLYDPSRDSSVGGDGPQRWSDPSTWGGDGDYLPAVQVYNLLRGISYKGTWLYGIQGMTAARLPVAHWIAQIEKCRAPIEGADGPEPTYRCSGEIDVDAPLGNALEAALTACQGRISEVGGVYKLYVGEPDAPVMAINDDDILSTEEQSFTPFHGLADTVNGISATYPSPAEDWNETTAPPLYRTDLEALAGNRRLMADVALNFVPYPEQVQRLMKSSLLDAQRQRRHTLTLPPKFWPLEPGDIVSWTSERNGYVAKWFRVEGVVDRANLDVIVDLIEVDPEDYDWNSETDFKAPVDGAVGPIKPAPRTVADWWAEASVVEDEHGAPRRPAILLSWDISDEFRLAEVEAIEYQVRDAVTKVVILEGRTDFPQAGSILVSHLLPATKYEVRGRYIPITEAHWDALWSDWLEVTTLDIRLSDKDLLVRLAAIRDDAYATLQRLRGDVIDVRDTIARLTLSSSEVVGRVAEEHKRIVTQGRATAKAFDEVYIDIEEIEGELVAQALAISGVETAIGEIEVDIGGLETTVGAHTVAIGALESTTSQLGDDIVTQGLAISQIESDISDIEGDVGGLASTVSGHASAIGALESEVSILDGDITAVAGDTSVLQAQVGQIAGSGLWKMEVVAGSGDVVARAVIMMRATISDDFVEVGTIWEAGFEGGNPALPFSRQVNFADQFVFTDGDDNYLPVVIEDGKLKAADLEVDFAKITNIVVTNAMLAGEIEGDKIKAGTLDVLRWAPAVAGDAYEWQISSPSRNAWAPGENIIALMGAGITELATNDGWSQIVSGGNLFQVSCGFHAIVDGSIRLKMEHCLASNSSNPALLRIYKNNTLIQTWSTTNVFPTFVARSLDVPVEAGDNITVFHAEQTSSAAGSFLRDIRVCTANAVIPIR